MGRGVSHCASCDGPLYNGQVVGVVGGGDSALQEALTLANFAESVLLFHAAKKFYRPAFVSRQSVERTQNRAALSNRRRRSFGRRSTERRARAQPGEQ